MVEVQELTNGEFELSINGKIAFMDFFAEWCMPCMMMDPIIDDIAEEFSEKIKFGKVNIDDNRKLTEKYSITSIPAFIIFKEGKPVERLVGLTTQDELAEVINKHL